MSKILFVVDPSTKSTGISVFRDEIIIDVECIKIPSAFSGKLAITYMCQKVIHKFKGYTDLFPNVSVVMEDQLWRGEEERMTPMAFATLYGLVCSLYCSFYLINNEKEVFLYVPREWKGTTPKDIMCARIYKKEIDKTWFKETDHDVLDAVGIGRFHMEKVKNGNKRK